MIEAVIFDVDGTLLDSVDLHAAAWQEALANFGYKTEFKEVRAQIGKGSDELLPVFVPQTELAVIKEHLDSFRSELFKHKYLEKVEAFPKVRQLFQRLISDGKRLALASSAKADELASYKRIAQIEDLVQIETSSDDAQRSKPNPDIFQAALKKLDSPNMAHCVAIGDTAYDAIAAGRAGLRTVGLLCGGTLESTLVEAGVVAVYRDPASLLQEYERRGDAVFERHPAAASSR